MNKVLEIKELYNVKSFKNDWQTFDGYMIKTEKDVYYFLIENGQSCCEMWGYISSDDDLNKYVGKELVSVEIVNLACDKISKILEEGYIQESECEFINVNFKNGDLLQLTVYNSHNGCYGHDVLFIKNKTLILDSYL